MQSRDQLHSQCVVEVVVACGVVFDFVARLDELEPVGAKAGRGFQTECLAAKVRACEAGANGDVPARVEHLLRFGVPGQFTKYGDLRVGHDEDLGLALERCVAMRPRGVQAAGAGAKRAWVGLAREEILVVPVKIWTMKRGDDDAKSLADCVSSAACPIAVLIMVEEAARVGWRRVGELCTRIPLAPRDVDLSTCYRQERNR